MPLVVNNNIASINAQNSLTRNNIALNKTLEKLSSGLRINRASDDAAGLQISETLRGQIRGQSKALANVQDGQSVLNIMDGAYTSIVGNLQRIRELTVQAANDSNTTAQRTAIEQEVNQLAAEITRVSDQTKFNGRALLNGSTSNFSVQIGGSANEQINLATAVDTVNPFADIDATVLSINALDYDGGSAGSVLTSLLTTIDAAINTVTARQAAVGALTNRLESAASNLMNSIENITAAESRVRDVDVAAETAKMIRSQILQQASASVLAQANQQPSLALSLIG